MRETRSSGSVEGVMGNHDSYSDSTLNVARRNARPIYGHDAATIFIQRCHRRRRRPLLFASFPIASILLCR
jgi:hypothetical protein